MSHAHLTEKGKKIILEKLDDLENKIDDCQALGELDANENAQSVLFGITTILRHEIDLMEVRN